MDLTHHLNRTVVIEADPEVVFTFFNDTERWAKWWGAGSVIDARPGGAVTIRYPNGVGVSGEVLEVRFPERIVFTYGYDNGTAMPRGSTRVTVRLEPVPSGTRLYLVHEFADETTRDMHVQGWRFQLSLFGNAVADYLHGNAEALVDAWFTAWAISGDTDRLQAFAAIASSGVSFRDRFSLLDGIEELNAHAGASQRFMPGVRLERAGPVRHCQGTLLADWAATTPDGKRIMTGTNVFLLGRDKRIKSVTGLADAQAAASAS